MLFRFLLITIAFAVTPLASISAPLPRGRTITGTFVYYAGGSGGGTIGLLVNGKIHRVNYSEPMKWSGLSQEEDVWYGAIWRITFGTGRRSREVVAIHNTGRVNGAVRSVWQLIVAYYERLRDRDCDAAFRLLGPPLSGNVTAQSLCSSTQAVTYDIRPFDTVQPNPLSRYGILLYGLKIIRWDDRESQVFINARQFVRDDNRHFALTIRRDGTAYRLCEIKAITPEAYGADRLER